MNRGQEVCLIIRKQNLRNGNKQQAAVLEQVKMSNPDPLQRTTSSLSSDTSEENDNGKRSLSYYRGFHTAEQRRPVKNRDTSNFSVFVNSAIAALPIAALLFFMSRRRAAAAAAAAKGGPQKKGFFADVAEQVQQSMNPLGTKDFTGIIEKKTFKDIIGVPEAVAEVEQYVQFLKQPEKFTRLGARLPKGCLLTGQPGTGKTMLAKAVAGEATVPFFFCSGADFIEVYAGSGPKRVRELFAAAKKAAPSVVFVDEIDAVGQRSNGQGSISSEENRTVNQLLAELDGLEANEAVIVFAATNYPENIDKALLREGRFDRKVEIPMPDRTARADLFTHYLNMVVTGDPKGATEASLNAAKSPSSTTPSTPSTVDAAPQVAATPLPVVDNRQIAERLAGLTPGVSPATIATIVNEAALASAVAGERAVKAETLHHAIDDVLVGKKHRNRMSEQATRRVALHESGHAMMAWMLPWQSAVIKLSVTPRGRAAGFTQQLGREALDHQTDRTLFSDICVMLGGRGAERQHDGTVFTTGAQDDLQRATRSAMQQFLAFGMSNEAGLLSYDYQRLEQGRMYQLYSEATQRTAEKEAEILVDVAWRVTQHILDTNKEKLIKLADALVEKKELLESDIQAILGARPTTFVDTEHMIESAMRRFVRKALEVGEAEKKIALEAQASATIAPGSTVEQILV